MNNHVLLSLAMSIIPVLAIGFVVILIIYKFFIKIRSRFNITVNCWFCNHNTKVPYLNANSWTCPLCDQYNGFTKDGDYNREIFEQLDCNAASESRCYASRSQPPEFFNNTHLTNGFCALCNEAQRLKVEKLAQFEPKKESRFDEELKVYQAQLEEQYRLCSTCDRHLNKVLREKKKMILGSKFLDFIIKGAENFKQPHLNQIDHMIKERRKKRMQNLIILLTIVNVFCLFSSTPTLKKEHVTQVFGESIGFPIFIATSHILALAKVLGSYFNVIKNHEFVIKLYLFSRTIFMMLMYSMGLKVNHITFAAWYEGIYPLTVLTLSLIYNVVDSFRLSRYTGMVVLWSLFAGGLVNQQEVLMLLSTIVTLGMTFTSKSIPSPKLHDSTANSFHKIYSEDYLSDDDTMSFLSQQQNGSSVSMRSVQSNNSFKSTPPMTRSRLTKSPLTSSTFSLNHMPRPQLSPNSSFRSYADNENQTMRSVFATPMPMAPLRQGLFTSNFELNSNRRPNGWNTSVGNSQMLNQSFADTRDATQFHNKTQDHNSSFFTAANASTISERGDHTFVQPYQTALSGIYSPFSASASAVYNHAQSPRFSTTNLVSHNPSNTSWLSGGYFNQRQSVPELPHNGLHLQMAGNASAAPMDEGMSRSSSHSSGFESQSGGVKLNRSRESSLCCEMNDFPQRTLNTDDINTFKPIDSPAIGPFAPRPSVLSNPNLNSSNALFSGGALWKQSAFTRRPIGGGGSSVFSHNSADSFNLRKINEELPAIKRPGEIFQQQWKLGQTIS